MIMSQSHSSTNSSRRGSLAEGSTSSHVNAVSRSRTGEVGSQQETRGVEQDEYDTDLEVDNDFGSVSKKAMKFDSSGKQLYIGACKMLKQVPASYYLRQSEGDTMRIRHHSLGVTGTKALCISLVSNTTIENLDLDDNGLECQGCVYVADMMKENYFITDLIISNNSIGYKGMIALFEVIKHSDSLISLDVSGNKVGDRAAAVIRSALVENNKLKNLNMSNNGLGDKTGAELGLMLEINVTLRQLNLSLNNLRMKGMQLFLRGLKKNHGLQHLNLAHNGIGLECCADLAKALKEDSSLLSLDISNNRIGLAGMLPISKAFKFNSTLLNLDLSRNPIQSTGCMVMAEFLTKFQNWGLRFLSFGNILVTKQFADMQKSLESSRHLLIMHGGVMEDWHKQTRISAQTSREALSFLTDDECAHLAERLQATRTNDRNRASLREISEAMEEMGWSGNMNREMIRRLEPLIQHSKIQYDSLL